MSQTIRIVEINDLFSGEILTYFPGEDEARGMVEDALSDGWLPEDDDYYITTTWYEIGEGESDTDEYFSEDELVNWYNKGGISEIEKNVMEKGYDINRIQSHTINISSSEIEYQDPFSKLYVMHL